MNEPTSREHVDWANAKVGTCRVDEPQSREHVEWPLVANDIVNLFVGGLLGHPGDIVNLCVGGVLGHPDDIVNLFGGCSSEPKR